jgi:hypothetical protein
MKKKVIYLLGAFVGLALLSFAYYALSPLFRNVVVNDASPALSDSEPSHSFSIEGTTGHPASGSVRIVNADNKRYVRYENFKTINGPDLYVYLAKDLDAKEYIDLGALKATEGNVNYEIPNDISTTEYPYVMVWCRAFGTLFNYADLSK